MKYFILLLFFVSCAQQPQVKHVEKNTFQELMNQDVQLIDVRTPEEYSAGHLYKAQNIDFKAPDFQEQISKLDKNKPVLIYCAAGGRSARASVVFETLGFKKIFDLNGGYMAW